MIIETKEVYKCEYCKKLYQIKKFAILHEERCTKNPMNFRSCFNCTHIEKITAKLTQNNYHGEQTYDVDILHCSKLNTFIYPPRTEYKQNAYLQEDLNDGKTENKPMPIKCIKQSKDY